MIIGNDIMAEQGADAMGEAELAMLEISSNLLLLSLGVRKCYLHQDSYFSLMTYMMLNNGNFNVVRDPKYYESYLVYNREHEDEVQEYLAMTNNIKKDQKMAELLGYLCPMTEQTQFSTAAGEKFVSVKVTMSLHNKTVTTQVYGFWCPGQRAAKEAAKQLTDVLRGVNKEVSDYLSFTVE